MCAGVATGFARSDGGRKQRASIRTLVVLPATVHFREKDHVGLLRDISPEGLFIYSDFTPCVGDSLSVDIGDARNPSGKRISCSGVVVRVESKATGAAIGIALRITAHDATPNRVYQSVE